MISPRKVQTNIINSNKNVHIYKKRNIFCQPITNIECSRLLIKKTIHQKNIYCDRRKLFENEKKRKKEIIRKLGSHNGLQTCRNHNPRTLRHQCSVEIT